MTKKSIRLKEESYKIRGEYFITICTHNRLHYFGEIQNEKQRLNDAGIMVEKIWFETINDFHQIQPLDFVLMPNHLHGIIQINTDFHDQSINEIVKVFKSKSTVNYIQGVKNKLFPSFEKKIWQTRYYDRYLRDFNELENAREYIYNNPKNWDKDIYNS